MSVPTSLFCSLYAAYYTSIQIGAQTDREQCLFVLFLTGGGQLNVRPDLVDRVLRAAASVHLNVKRTHELRA
jgi:hypothetical protein